MFDARGAHRGSHPARGARRPPERRRATASGAGSSLQGQGGCGARRRRGGGGRHAHAFDSACEHYASSTRLDWRTLLKRTFDIDLRVRVAPLRRKAHRTRARHRPDRHRQDAHRAQAPAPRPRPEPYRQTARHVAPWRTRVSRTPPTAAFPAPLELRPPTHPATAPLHGPSPTFSPTMPDSLGTPGWIART